MCQIEKLKTLIKTITDFSGPFYMHIKPIVPKNILVLIITYIENVMLDKAVDENSIALIKAAIDTYRMQQGCEEVSDFTKKTFYTYFAILSHLVYLCSVICSYRASLILAWEKTRITHKEALAQELEKNAVCLEASRQTLIEATEYLQTLDRKSVHTLGDYQDARANYEQAVLDVKQYQKSALIERAKVDGLLRVETWLKQECEALIEELKNIAYLMERFTICDKATAQLYEAFVTKKLSPNEYIKQLEENDQSSTTYNGRLDAWVEKGKQVYSRHYVDQPERIKNKFASLTNNRVSKFKFLQDDVLPISKQLIAMYNKGIQLKTTQQANLNRSINVRASTLVEATKKRNANKTGYYNAGKVYLEQQHQRMNKESEFQRLQATQKELEEKQKNEIVLSTLIAKNAELQSKGDAILKAIIFLENAMLTKAYSVNSFDSTQFITRLHEHISSSLIICTENMKQCFIQSTLTGCFTEGDPLGIYVTIKDEEQEDVTVMRSVRKNKLYKNKSK